jgi:hypothetical protein
VSAQAGGKHARVIRHEQVAASQQPRQVVDVMVCHRARDPVEVQEARGATFRKRRLRDQLR